MIPLPQPPKVIEKKGNTATFEIEGLYPGYGVTIGNGLRRTLLSSLEGSAITRVKIRGAQHEFSTLPGIQEDILQLTLNLKQIRCKIYTEEPQKLEISVRGERKVTAKDIKAPTQVKIVNPDAYIAELTSKNASLDMELLVERGFGYVQAEHRRKEKLEIGTLMLDAIFTPVHRVAFRVENMRVGERTDFDRLFIEIETDGTISPEFALGEAAGILERQFGLMRQAFPPEDQRSLEERKGGKKKTTSEKQGEDIAKRSVEELKISTRTMNLLMENNVKTIGGLLRKSESSLAELEGMGEAGIKEIKKALKKMGMELKS